MPWAFRSAFRLLVLLELAAASAIAQFRLDSWTADNGLPQNILRGIGQTRDGYLWIATLDGLVRFDGVRFTVFSKTNTRGIQSNRFTSLYFAPNGDFWAGTEAGGVTRCQRGNFITYTREQGLPEGAVTGVAGDATGRIWASSGAVILEWREKERKFVPVERGYYYPLAFQNARGFGRVVNGEVQLFTGGGISHYALPEHWPKRQTVVSQDLSGNIWIAAEDGHNAELRGAQWSKIFNSGAASYTYRDSQGHALPITVGYNLTSWLTLPTRSGPQSIPITGLFEDREGNVWLSTDGRGLLCIRSETVRTYSKEEGMPARNVYPIFQDKAGYIWLGTWGGGLACFKGGKFRTYTTADGLDSNLVYSIMQERNGTLWVASGGVVQYLSGGRFRPVQENALAGLNSIRAMHEDREGTLWFGSDKGLVFRKGEQWGRVTIRDGLASDDVRVIIDGRAGNLWIGGYGGLTREENGHFRKWTERDGLPATTIRALYEDTSGALWIGTYDGGLIRFLNGRFTHFTVGDGLFNNGVFQILEDSRQNLWMSCNRGIYRVRKEELNDFTAGKRKTIASIAYGRSEGMLNAECNGGVWPAGIRAQDGKLWFPTQDGAAVIDPEAVRINSRPPPVTVESILLDGNPVSLDDPIRIRPGQENVEIQYTALSFINSGNIHFRYEMAGLDKDWVEAGVRRSAWYSHMPAGDYDFRVIARNSDGVWNMQGQTLHVSVLPHFYQTWWFLASLLVGTAALIATGWRNRERQLKRAHAQQEAFSRRLINSQETERQRIAAELHDSLGQTLLVIKNRANLASHALGDSEAAQEQLDEISASASDAIDEVRTIAHNLRPYHLDRFGLTRTLRAMCTQATRSSGIGFQVEMDSIDGLFPKQTEINVYRIIQEAVNNVIKHSGASEARFLVQRREQAVELSIRDNGRGFNGMMRDGQKAETAEASPGGFGFIGMAERARLIGGTFAVNSIPDSGTTITINLAVRNPGYEE